MPTFTYHLEALGLCIAEHRRFVGLSRAELSRRSGISLDLLQSLEQRRHRNPSLNTLIRLAEGLGISVGDLVGGITTQAPAEPVPDRVEEPLLIMH